MKTQEKAYPGDVTIKIVAYIKEHVISEEKPQYFSNFLQCLYCRSR